MKLFFFKSYAASVILLCLVSCSIDNDVLQEPRIESGDLFYAEIEQVDSSTPESRAYVDDQLRVLWHKDDRISIFNHPDGNLITRGLGDIGASSEAETAVIPIREGDIMISCSDGLCSMCRDKTIEQIVTEYSQRLPSCRDALVKAALQAGGYDNITVSVLATASSSGDERKSFRGCIKRLFKR